jgi:preprotein translocase subunit SecG
MQNVLLVVHLMACIALVGSVLLQRSEGGALGMGGGGTGGFISGRGAANALVRVSMVLAGIFFLTSITLTRLNSDATRAPSDVERELEELQRSGAAAPRPVEAPLGSPLGSPTATAPAPASAAAPPPPVSETPDPAGTPASPAPAPAQP